MRVTSPSPISPTIAKYLENLSPAHVTRRLNFYDDFNRTAEDTDVWTSGGDDGTFAAAYSALIGEATAWRMGTGNVIDNDRYIHGADVKNNKAFSPWEDGFTTVTWEARLKLASIADVSAFWGLLWSPCTDYEEPATRSAVFFADPVVSANYQARTYLGAETQVDTGVALDTDFHRFKMVWVGATSIEFYIDDVLVATIDTNLPGAAMISEFLIRTEAAVVKYLDIDALAVEVS